MEEEITEEKDRFNEDEAANATSLFEQLYFWAFSVMLTNCYVIYRRIFQEEGVTPAYSIGPKIEIS